ncbi:hypothetical protein [Tsukamurella pseudospumae]|uniref:Uncharacterized protein n=1 Tax=Tsukamurella pseudospumae TaxID=239498 RepID=A0A138AUK9_9ACTN|nr:hypothetical protein [Tsukamurella pseudospumae]KXP14066.1 hypothetical protein AXK60_21475 [Tsukamurella pseudospumae]
MEKAGSQPAGDAHRLGRTEEARVDAALAEYRDRTYAQWSAPGIYSGQSPLGDRAIEAAIRSAPAPVLPRRRLRYALGAAAAAVGILAGAVALGTVAEPDGAIPEPGVLLAAASPGGDRGPFADGAALARCLDAASVPLARRTLVGAGRIDLRGERTTVLLLPGGDLGDLRVLAVTPSCAQGESSAVLVDRVLPAGAAARAATP